LFAAMITWDGGHIKIVFLPPVHVVRRHDHLRDSGRMSRRPRRAAQAAATTAMITWYGGHVKDRMR
jgi:hypothetical protein